MVAFLGMVVAYLIGSISFSTLITRWVAHVDIREHGSGNAGATNTLRVIGIKWGVAVLLLDVLKGAIVVILTRFVLGLPELTTLLCGLAVIAGHNWPVFFRFRGGKGIATTIGVLFVTMPHPSWVAGCFALAIVVLTRYVSLGSMSFTVLVPMFSAFIYSNSLPVVFSAVIAAFSLFRHRHNMLRLWSGTESRLLAKTKSEDHSS